MHYLTELSEKKSLSRVSFSPKWKREGEERLKELNSSFFFDERGILKLLRRKWVLQIRESEEEERLEI